MVKAEVVAYKLSSPHRGITLPCPTAPGLC
jgi:hypothetical protein